MGKTHKYKLSVNWSGNTGNGTQGYNAYGRSHSIQADHKPIIFGSSDPAFRGDAAKYNPEELFLASVSACHMLWYLHLCSAEGVVVMEYIDHAIGTMEETEDGRGRFTSITLHPMVTVAMASMKEKAQALHTKANKYCFIANSLNFPVHHLPECSAIEQQ